MTPDKLIADVSEVARLREKATPGEWKSKADYGPDRSYEWLNVRGPDNSPIASMWLTLGGLPTAIATAEFIASTSRIDFQSLAAELVRLRDIESAHAAAVRECEKRMTAKIAFDSENLIPTKSIYEILTGAP
jgi:hypothetical protein